jgi:phosphohistidine phosphatase SixA
MALHLVRHGEAGARGEDGNDESRALTARGRSQADAVAALLADQPIRWVCTSRYLRCAQTVQPLADRLDLPATVDEALAEEAKIDETWALVERLLQCDGDAVLCSHGNVLQALLDRVHRRGAELVADELSFRKGAVWTLEPDGDGGVSRAVLTPPLA